VENAALSLVINLALAWFLMWSALLRRQLWLSLRPQGQRRPNRHDVLSARVPHDLDGWGPMMVVHKHAAARRVRKAPRRAAPVVASHVHPLAFETALRLAQGGPAPARGLRFPDGTRSE